MHCLMGGAYWKMVQMKTLFHTFTHGYLMLEYKFLYEFVCELGNQQVGIEPKLCIFII